MSHKKDQPHSQEHSSDVQVRVVNVSHEDTGLDLEVGTVGEQVNEVAKENLSENSKGGKAKSQGIRKDQKKDPALEERLLLREELLKHAPKAPVMRRDVEAILLTKKAAIERDIRKLSRGTDFELLSKAVAQLRHLVHQLELVAHASYEVLKGIWLRVVHKMA